MIILWQPPAQTQNSGEVKRITNAARVDQGKNVPGGRGWAWHTSLDQEYYHQIWIRLTGTGKVTKMKIALQKGFEQVFLPPLSRGCKKLLPKVSVEPADCHIGSVC